MVFYCGSNLHFFYYEGGYFSFLAIYTFSCMCFNVLFTNFRHVIFGGGWKVPICHSNLFQVLM